MKIKLSNNSIQAIEKALSKGNVVEVKRERDQVVVVEIQRQVINKDYSQEGE